MRPILEYSSAVWDPHTATDVLSLEKYKEELPDGLCLIMVEPVVSPLCYLICSGQPCLTVGDQQDYLLFTNHLSSPPLPAYFTTTNQQTRYFHDLHYIIPSVRTNAYKYSFFPRTIKEWNSLPTNIIETNSPQSFLYQLNSHYSSDIY